MKKSFIILCLSVSLLSVMAQKPISEILKTDSATVKFAYCELVLRHAPFSGRVTVNIDYGQQTTWSWFNYERELRDGNGQPYVFNSVIDALNFMGDKGWDLVQTYTVYSTAEVSSGILHWVLKKRMQKQELPQ
jgi:hypothetical protein